MTAAVWSDSDLREIARRRDTGEPWASIAPDDPDAARMRYSKARRTGRLARALAGSGGTPPAPVAPGSAAGSGPGGVVAGEEVTWTETPEGATVEAPRSGRITTLDALLAAAEVDLTRWYVERYIINKWEVGARDSDGAVTVEPLWQVKAWLRPLPGVDLAREVLNDLLADMAQHAPRYPAVRYAHPAAEDRHMLEVCLMDLHIGMLAWGEETGADYDSDIARDLVADAVSVLVDRARAFPVERVLLPLGNDIMHADRTIAGAGGSTRAGTPLDVDTRRARMVRMVRTVAVETIDALRALAPVEVLVVPGNHDEESAFALGEIVNAWYRLDDAVTVRNDPAPRKYVRYGTALLGFCHGHNEKPAALPLLMATEAATDWAETTHREWHIGHKHRKGEAVEEHTGVRVRVMPSLAGEDAWHAHQGYRHMRAAEAYLWHQDTGYVGHFSVGMPDVMPSANSATR